MAQLTDMGIPAASSVRGILQPFHRHRWQLQFVIPQIGNGTKYLTAMAITADRPKLEFEEIQLDRYNSRAYIYGKHTFQPISVVFEPDIGGRVHSAVIEQLEKQQHLIADNNRRFMGQAEAGEDYKFALKMQMLNGNHTDARGGTNNVLEEWILEGCGFTNNDFGDLDYQASETLKTSLTIRYDHARCIIRNKNDRYATGGPNI